MVKNYMMWLTLREYVPWILPRGSALKIMAHRLMFLNTTLMGVFEAQNAKILWVYLHDVGGKRAHFAYRGDFWGEILLWLLLHRCL